MSVNMREYKSKVKPIELEVNQMDHAAKLFQGWQETMIWSCMQGVMGNVFADSAQDPVSAMAVLGDFCFLAGVHSCEMLQFLQNHKRRDFRIMIPQHQGWADLIESFYGERANKTIRYAIKKEPLVFHQEKLQAMAERLPDGYTMKQIEEALFWRCRQISWCRDWVMQYENYALWQKYGLGFVILKDDEPVSGASSYSGYKGGIEIEIDTREDCRRMGLAAICGAKLILECLDRGWYPSWDAQNQWSLGLAQKLGYHFDYEYTAYEVRDF